MVTKNYAFSYVYQVTNKKTGEFYVGIRSCNCDPTEDVYWGSGIRIKRCIEKNGIDNFEKKIFSIFNCRKEASQLESELVNEETLKNELCLNLKTGGEYFYNVKYHENFKKHLSDSLKAFYKNNPEARNDLSKRVTAFYKDNSEARKLISDMRARMCQDPEFVARFKEVRRKLHLETDLNMRIKEGLNKPEVKQKRSQSLHSFAVSEIGRKQKSEATKGTVYVNKNGETKRVKKENLLSFTNDGWSLGIGYSVTQDTKSKLSCVAKGRKWMFNEALKQTKRVKPEDVPDFLSRGWIAGQKVW